MLSSIQVTAGQMYSPPEPPEGELEDNIEEHHRGIGQVGPVAGGKEEDDVEEHHHDEEADEDPRDQLLLVVRDAERLVAHDGKGENGARLVPDLHVAPDRFAPRNVQGEQGIAVGHGPAGEGDVIPGGQAVNPPVGMEHEKVHKVDVGKVEHHEIARVRKRLDLESRPEDAALKCGIGLVGGSHLPPRSLPHLVKRLDPGEIPQNFAVPSELDARFPLEHDGISESARDRHDEKRCAAKENESSLHPLFRCTKVSTQKHRNFRLLAQTYRECSQDCYKGFLRREKPLPHAPIAILGALTAYYRDL